MHIQGSCEHLQYTWICKGRWNYKIGMIVPKSFSSFNIIMYRTYDCNTVAVLLFKTLFLRIKWPFFEELLHKSTTPVCWFRPPDGEV